MNRKSDLLLCMLRRHRSTARVNGCAVLMTSALMAGCGTSLNRAPVEDRTAARTTASAPAAAAATAPAEVPGKPLPGVENLGKPGY